MEARARGESTRNLVCRLQTTMDSSFGCENAQVDYLKNILSRMGQLSMPSENRESAPGELQSAELVIPDRIPYESIPTYLAEGTSRTDLATCESTVKSDLQQVINLDARISSGQSTAVPGNAATAITDEIQRGLGDQAQGEACLETPGFPHQTCTECSRVVGNRHTLHRALETERSFLSTWTRDKHDESTPDRRTALRKEASTAKHATRAECHARNATEAMVQGAHARILLERIATMRVCLDSLEPVDRFRTRAKREQASHLRTEHSRIRAKRMENLEALCNERSESLNKESCVAQSRIQHEAEFSRKAWNLRRLASRLECLAHQRGRLLVMETALRKKVCLARHTLTAMSETPQLPLPCTKQDVSKASILKQRVGSTLPDTRHCALSPCVFYRTAATEDQGLARLSLQFERLPGQLRLADPYCTSNEGAQVLDEARDLAQSTAKSLSQVLAIHNAAIAEARNQPSSSVYRDLAIWAAFHTHVAHSERSVK